MTGLKEAFAECNSYECEDDIPWQKTADKHGVVRSTLTRKYRGQTASREEAGLARRTLPPQAEDKLVDYIDKLTEAHLPPTREMVQNFASDIAGKRVSMSWVDRMIHRRSDELTPQWSTSMDRQRHAADSHDKYQKYFDLLSEKIKFYDVEPENTYNMDEKGFMIGAIGRQKRIFSKRLFKKRQYRQQLQDGNREWISLLACCCADGTFIPPALIYAADSENIQNVWVEDVKVGEHMAFFGVSQSGWSNDSLGMAWLQQVFQRYTSKKARRRYRLLLVDGHGSHLTEEFLEYCHRQKILLAVYPPHSTHTLQPLDVVMFKPLSTAYSKKLGERLFKHQGLVPVKKTDFFELFWDAWVTSFTEKNILSSFKCTGVVPFNPSVILNRFVNNDSDTSSSSDSDASYYSGDEWRLLDRVARRALSGASEKDASIVRQSLHHIAIENTLLKGEIEGLRDALVYKRRGEARGKALDLLQHYEYWGPKMLWTPRSFREAKTRMRLAKQEREVEEKKKADMKRDAAIAKRYNEQVAAEKRAQRVREKEVRDQQKAEKRAAIDARKAERARQKAERDAEKASQSTQKGKRKLPQKGAVKKKQKRSVAAARSMAVGEAPAPAAPAKTSSRGRKINLPDKYK